MNTIKHKRAAVVAALRTTANTTRRISEAGCIGSFNFITGATRGDIGVPDSEVVQAVTTWVADNDGKAVFRRKRGADGVIRLVLSASIVEGAAG